MAEALAVRQSVVVKAPIERAFRVFTTGIGTWWPRGSHYVGEHPPVEEVMEPRVGGRCFERDAEGNECQWGCVRVWEPPLRLVIAWELDATWKFDPENPSEVEVTFSTEDDGRTRVELVHHKLEVYGDQAEQLRDTYGDDDGWAGLLARYAWAV